MSVVSEQDKAQDSLALILALPFSQIFPTIDSLPASGLTPRLYDWSVSFEHLGFLFLFFSLVFFCCGSVLQIKLAMLAFGRT